MYRLRLLHGTKTACLCKFDRYGMHYHILIPLEEDALFLVIPLTSQAENYQRLVDAGQLERCIDVSPSVKGFDKLTKHTIINHNAAFVAVADDILRHPKFQSINSDIDVGLLHELLKVLCASRHIKRGVIKAIKRIYQV